MPCVLSRYQHVATETDNQHNNDPQLGMCNKLVVTHKNYCKKGDDLYWLLNLACIKYTGQPLPADGETANEWRYAMDDRYSHTSTSPTLIGVGKDAPYGIAPTRNPLSIMSYDTSNGLDKQIKRSMICDEIKKIRTNYYWYLEIAKQFHELGITSETVNDTFTTQSTETLLAQFWEAEKEPWHRANFNKKVLTICRELAYDCITGSASPELIKLVKASKKPDCPNEKLVYLFQDIAFKRRAHNILDDQPEKIDRLLSRSLTIDKSKGGLCITRQNKLRKGMELDFMYKYIAMLPYFPSFYSKRQHGAFPNRIGEVRQNIYILSCYDMRNLPECMPHLWVRYKMDSGMMDTATLLGAFNGVPKDRREKLESKLSLALVTCRKSDE